MSWRDDLSAAQARLVALEEAELAILRGKQVRQVSYAGQLTEWQNGATLADVRAAISETRTVIARLNGCGGARRAFVPTFRG